MTWGLVFYNIITGILFLVGFPFLILYNLTQGKYSSRLVERLGRYPLNLRPDYELPQSRPLWIHGVSVGEVKAAVALIQRIKEQLPHVPLLLSTTTPAGRETAERLLGNEIPVIYYPLDFYPCVKKALGFFRPRAFIALETELWPNFLSRAHKTGSLLMLVNGRISERSFRRYSKLRWLFQPLLAEFRLLLVRHKDDADYLTALGARPERMRILGNIKFDGLTDQARETVKAGIRKKVPIPEESPVLVAGSTRGGEEPILLAAYLKLKDKFPDLRLILVPRHINRCPEIALLLKKKGTPCQLYTRLLQGEPLDETAVILVDKIGDLFALYSLATVTFCGASLVPKGGQNIFEPAAWGKPVFYGPFMEDFKDARSLLEAVGAGIPVADETDLLNRVDYFLGHPREAAERGEAGRRALQSQTGLTGKAAGMIAEIVRPRG
jgi:3-deoxy-D-manno-octulosonic-acid transferase